jgi:hypothetical protein
MNNEDIIEKKFNFKILLIYILMGEFLEFNGPATHVGKEAQ